MPVVSHILTVPSTDDGGRYHNRDKIVAQLPIDVVDAILDNYLHHDMQTLAHCSLVSRSWSPLARRHRFREVKITPCSDGRPQSASFFCDPTSTVLPFIQSLTLIESIGDGNYGGYHSHWLDDALPAIRVSHLTALNRLVVELFQWTELSSSSRSNFMSLLERVTFLRLQPRDNQSLTCSAMAQILASAVSLERFTLLLPSPSTGAIADI